MSIDIYFYQNRVGSNPGGKCTVSCFGEREFYLKYIEGVKLPMGSPFCADHQDIYEAMTLMLGKTMGLLVPRFYVLANPDRDANLSYAEGVHRLNPHRGFYFMSELAHDCSAGSDDGRLEERLSELVHSERLYRDLIMVSDVENKRQNYMPSDTDCQSVLYIDLGCCFVNAVEGFISIPHS